MPEKSTPSIPKPVFILGLVSLLTDVASEMLYPVAPLYLTTVLRSPVAIVGVLEGVAEFLAGILKGYFGTLSDRMGLRARFVRAGYALSALAKPLPGVWGTTAGVVTGRLADRLGKGMRSAPRDALLAGYGTPQTRGAIFGFHRAMDTTGAVIGPIAALCFLAFYPNAYRELFLLAFVPSALAVMATFFVRDVAFTPRQESKKFTPFSVFSYWRESPWVYRRLVVALTLFAFVNSSDVFLILKAQHVGFSSIAAIGGYIFYNIIYAIASYPLGKTADALGKRQVLVGGLLLYIGVYGGFAVSSHMWQIWGLFGLYGVYAAATEGVSKAWIADLVPNEQRGSAIGLQTMLSSFGTLAASIIAGQLWDHVSISAPFWFAVVGSFLAMLLLLFQKPERI